MAQINEVFAKRSVSIDGTAPTATREYHISGVDTEQAALDILRASALCPDEIELDWAPEDDAAQVTYTLTRQRVEVEEVVTPEDPDSFLWHGLARYTLVDSNSTGGNIEWTQPPKIRWQMDFGTDTVIQKIALAQTRFGTGGPDCGKRLSVVNREGRDSVEGIPVLVPTGILRGTQTYTASAWNNILTTAKDHIGKVNASTFNADGMTFQPYELLFVGATVRQNSDGSIDGEFQFLYSPGVSGETDGIDWSKAGWDALWAYYSVALDGNWQIEKALSVYVATVYQASNFGNLFD